MSLEIIKEKVINMWLNGFLWLIWASAKYFYYILTGKEPRFSFIRLCLNMFLWVVIWVMIWEFIPKDWLVRDWLVILGWIGSFELIKKIEKDWLIWTIDEILLIFKKK
jgi:hypothetical protein